MWQGVLTFFVLIGSTVVMEPEKLFFNSINTNFFDSDSMRSNNTTPTSAHVKKESSNVWRWQL